MIMYFKMRSCVLVLWIDEEKQIKEDIKKYGFAKTKLEKTAPTLWTNINS